MMAEEIDYRHVLLQFIGSLTLCDHMGDVSNDVDTVLKKIGIDIEWNEWHELGHALGDMGITTLQGTPLTREESEEGV